MLRNNGPQSKHVFKCSIKYDVPLNLHLQGSRRLSQHPFSAFLIYFVLHPLFAPLNECELQGIPSTGVFFRIFCILRICLVEQLLLLWRDGIG